MAERAQISSVEAIESFRSRLIEYISQMRPTLGEIGSEVTRTRGWLEGDQRLYWANELRLRSRRLEEAKSELSNALMAQLSESAALHRVAVRRAQQAVAEAEEKLKRLKKWSRELENLTAPLVKQVEQLHGYLAVDMVKGVAYLDNVLKALEAYRQVTPTHGNSPVNSSPAGSDAATSPPAAEPKTEEAP